jgi:hypothetical protein
MQTQFMCTPSHKQPVRQSMLSSDLFARLPLLLPPPKQVQARVCYCWCSAGGASIQVRADGHPHSDFATMSGNTAEVMLSHTSIRARGHLKGAVLYMCFSVLSVQASADCLQTIANCLPGLVRKSISLLLRVR